MDAERLPEWVFEDIELRLSWQETIFLSMWHSEGQNQWSFLWNLRKSICIWGGVEAGSLDPISSHRAMEEAKLNKSKKHVENAIFGLSPDNTG